ncbi:MAG: alcohol dehydrogenase [Alphaproteobacteria bacterium]|nr:alcohol dehydrogenase [Alphaproteobacteria bacterium]MBU6471035.1 alcohol dehydrogenase [Alphaproteobacteria bacterium]MDE2013134.1 alcohol dehydrogenase catalytic domain-containing protein [Alphaproteobacteria bacterium]MDE2072751.1 alcohol dehydrogenase catalytic domain-containing protein [Alphaproteobacteria bacterium]MDE2352125.1 alcohol dehydrogenase catalytic domain-containing protein [Alphaproteobacteria bacterium]
MRSQAIMEFGKPLQAVEAPTPVPNGTEVLLKVEYSGVCHSDVHLHDGYFDLGGGNKLPLSNLKFPHTLGHEIEGEVAALGPDAKGVSLGQHYAAYPWIGCGDCPACKRGEENLCARPRQLGCSPGCPGGYASHVMIPHPRYLLDFGKTRPELAAAYMCSGLTAFGAMKKVGKLGPDDQVVVLGCGGVGMMGVQFAKALFGKGPIAADIDEGRLEAAKKAGASATYNTKDPAAAKQLMADTGGGAYAVVDFVGSEATFAFASKIVRKGGRIVIVGLFGGAMSMPIPMFPLKVISIAGTYVGTLTEAQEMMALVRDGKIDPIPVQMRPLDQASQALDDLRGGRITGRVVLTP